MSTIFSPRRFVVLLVCFLLSLLVAQLRGRIDGQTYVPAISAPVYTSNTARNAQSDDVLLATSVNAYAALSHAMRIGDGVGITYLMLRGDILVVKRGTRVQSIEHTSTRIKVRVLEGPVSGKEGWIEAESVESQ